MVSPSRDPTGLLKRKEDKPMYACNDVEKQRALTDPNNPNNPNKVTDEFDAGS